MPIYLGNTEIGSELVGSYGLGNVYLGANQIGFGSNGEIKSNTLVGNFNTWDPASYPGSGSTWNNLVAGGGNLTLVNSPTFTQEGGYFPTNYFTMTYYTASYATGSLTYIAEPDVIMMQAWVYITTGDDTYGLINLGNLDPRGGGNYLSLGVRTDGKLGAFFNNYNDGFTASNTLNQWVNIAATVNGNVLKGYVNGVNVGFSNTFNVFYTGTQQLLIPTVYPGNIAQVLVSNNVADLNDDVIYNNYFATKQYFGY